MFDNPKRDETFFENPLKKRFAFFSFSLLFVVFVFLFYLAFWSAPRYFPVDTIYDLKSGQTLSLIASNFSAKRIIRSEFWFKSFVYIFSLGKSKIIEGNYYLKDRQDVILMAWRVSQGLLDAVPFKIVIQEGLNNREIADVFASKLSSFNKDRFLKFAEKLEGYLFPDTYNVTTDMTEEQIIKMMNDNFNRKIKEFENEIKLSGKNLSDIVKIASILEEEARTFESRSIISGILWKRLSINMPLQVDCSFKYINGKTSATLSLEDLKLDSPYNSYLHRGLPPTAISNPGLMAIKASIMPIKTDYLYFLSDHEGNMHYAKTHDEHVENKEKYLR
ncbi:MAG: endolytic transglycosylase MltG [Candidatus Taylorbacteria bacterium]|nr:endolytic transglycosylase MltG [Candidatus Taylorbacteria bacterium]